MRRVLGGGEWRDVEFLQTLSSRATQVTLGEGQSRTVSLRLINRLIRTVVVAAVVLSLTALNAAAQTAPQAQGSGRVTLRGVVVDAGDGSALRRARLTLTSGRATVGSVSTDDDGRFSVGVAPTTTLLIRIVKAGYATIILRVPEQQIRASEERRQGVPGDGDPLRLEVPRGAVIAGRAIDASGQPAQIVVIRRVTSDGTARSAAGPDGVTRVTVGPDVVTRVTVGPDVVTRVAVGPDGVSVADDLATVTPDDRGEYRAGGLAAGRYVIEAYPSAVAITIQKTAGREVFTTVCLSTACSAQGASAFQVSSATVDVQTGSEATVDLMLERRASEPPAADLRALGSTIRGTVSTTDGAPLADAAVSAGRGAPTARTDTFGRFTVRGVSPGSVTVQASKRGYVQSEYGQRGGGLPGLPITIEAGKDVDNLSIVLPRAGVVSGMVIDELGEPILEASVELLRVRRQPTGAFVREQGARMRPTDDRGQFRFSDVGPGEFIVMASLPAETVDPAVAARTVSVPAYYPDTPDFANAASIRIADGENIPGLVLTMRRVPVVRVAGVARNSQGLPFTGTLQLSLRHAGAISPEARVVQPEATGEFVFASVPPGDYLLRAQVATGPAGPELASAHVTVVDRDPPPVPIRTSPGSTVSGRLVLEGGTGDLLWGYSATSVPIEFALSPGSVSNLGSPISTGEPFTLKALAGPTRLRVWSDDQNWYLKSILIDGFDVADTPFDFGSDGRTYSNVEVVFSRLGATIAGRATDERAAPVRDYAVYVFAADRDKWFGGSRWIKLVRATTDGGFKVVSLPPGDYWVAAIDRVDASPGAADSVDAELFEMLSSRATRVTLGESQAQTINLRLINR